MPYKYQPIILIGAARSGTKLLRDLIAEHPDVDKIPYDINFIWRLGNEEVRHDELPIASINAKVRERILKKIGRFSHGAPFLMEKSVSNCLRVPFVHAIFPDAIFIHLLRDGFDVVESAYRQWVSPPRLSYILKKLRYFPLTDAWGYGLRYAKNLAGKVIVPARQNSGTWGPRYSGIDENVATKALIEVCAIQWANSVEKAMAGLRQLPDNQLVTIRYEELVKNPIEHLKMIAQVLGLAPEPYIEGYKCRNVEKTKVSHGHRRLSDEQKARISPWIKKAQTLLDSAQDYVILD